MFTIFFKYALRIQEEIGYSPCLKDLYSVRKKDKKKKSNGNNSRYLGQLANQSRKTRDARWAGRADSWIALELYIRARTGGSASQAPPNKHCLGVGAMREQVSKDQST